MKQDKSTNVDLKNETPADAKPVLVAVGQRCYIDKNFANGGMVEVVAIYGKHYCRVRCTETKVEWDTMLYRLSNCH